MSSGVFRTVVAGLVFSLAATASPVHAAKGVKKVGTGSGPKTFSGVVVSVIPNGTGFGTFHIRTTHHRKNVMNNAAVAGANNAVNNGNGTTHHHTHEFNVTASTQFVHHNGTAANASLLHTGERVRVRAVSNQAANAAAGNAVAANVAGGSSTTGRHQAIAVQFMSHHRSRGMFTRHRTSGYYPHYHHHYHRR